MGLYRGDRTRRVIAHPDGLRFVACLLAHLRDISVDGIIAMKERDMPTALAEAAHAAGHAHELASVVGLRGAQRLIAERVNPQSRRMAARRPAAPRVADVWPIRPQDGSSGPERDVPGRVDPIDGRPRRS